MGGWERCEILIMILIQIYYSYFYEPFTAVGDRALMQPHGLWLLNAAEHYGGKLSLHCFKVKTNENMNSGLGNYVFILSYVGWEEQKEPVSQCRFSRSNKPVRG